MGLSSRALRLLAPPRSDPVARFPAADRRPGGPPSDNLRARRDRAGGTEARGVGAFASRIRDGWSGIVEPETRNHQLSRVARLARRLYGGRPCGPDDRVRQALTTQHASRAYG